MITPGPATGIQMVSGWLAAQPVVCARTIRGTYDGGFSLTAQPGVMLKLAIVRDGPYALVGWAAGEEGGYSLFHHRGDRWCRTSNGGGAIEERDVIGFDGIDRATAQRLFRGRAKAVRESARAR